MQTIKMVDLLGQYASIKDEIDRAIREVVNTSSFIAGPSLQRFKNNLQSYLGVKHVIPCANGTDALQLTLMALELEKGDEVITTNFTFASTVETIALLGLVPVLIDINPETFNIDVQQIEKKITKKTKAIIPVHLFGQPANMDEIMNLANAAQLIVIEDNAQSIGATYRMKHNKREVKTGAIGHMGTLSFFPSKNLGAYGDGGAVTTNDDYYAEKIACLSNHGMYKRYYHDKIGINSRLDGLQAAILDVKLKYLDEYNIKRSEIAKKYDAQLTDCKHIILPCQPNKQLTHVFHQYTVRVLNSRRDKLAEYLKQKNIPTAIYYPIPLHRQKAYKEFGYSDQDFKVSIPFSGEVLSLPIHTELDDDMIGYIATEILNFFD